MTPLSQAAEQYLDADHALQTILNADGPIEFDALVAHVKRKTDAMHSLELVALEFFEASENALEAYTSGGNRWIMTESLRKPNLIQLTYFSSDGLPFGDLQYTNKIAAVQELFRSTKLETIQNYSGIKFFEFEPSQKQSLSI